MFLLTSCVGDLCDDVALMNFAGIGGFSRESESCTDTYEEPNGNEQDSEAG